MRKGLLVLLCGLGLASAQVIPLHLCLEAGLQVVAFVQEDCQACERLPSQLFGLGAVYLGAEEDLLYPRYLQDERNIAAQTFRIQRYPTVVVLQDGQEVIRQVEQVDAEVLAATVVALREGRFPVWRIGVEVGQRAEGYFEGFTGLLVIWHEDCEACGHEGEELLALVESGIAEIVVTGVDEGWPPGIRGVPAPGIHEVWSVGQHAHILLEEGVVLWVSRGYQENLAELVAALIEVIRDKSRPKPA